MPKNKITFGLRNVHYAIANLDNNGELRYSSRFTRRTRILK